MYHHFKTSRKVSRSQDKQQISFTFFLPHFITSAARRFWSLSELMVTAHCYLCKFGNGTTIRRLVMIDTSSIFTCFLHYTHNSVYIEKKEAKAFQPSGFCQKGCGELLRRSENCQLSELIKQKSISHLYWIGLTFIKEMKINVAWHTVTQ